jgi:hypothetical protein
MSKGDGAFVDNVERKLTEYSALTRQLPGVSDRTNLHSLALQIKDSWHRVRYAERILQRPFSPERANPANGQLFHPIKGSLVKMRSGDRDEAFWLVFLYTHFGRHKKLGWTLASEVYGGHDGGGLWSWIRVSREMQGFRNWLSNYAARVGERRPQIGFGNHRKFQSLDAWSSSGTGEAVSTYVSWVLEHGGHGALINQALRAADGEPRLAFDWLYREMSRVATFGRLGRFDYLCMVGKLKYGGIEPGRLYMQGATGPVVGVRLLLGASAAAMTCAEMEIEMSRIERHLSLGPFGMQILEDSLCNWQKSPGEHSRFVA